MAERLLKGPFSVDDYHRMADLGILDEDDRVELLDGQVVEMTPLGPEHAACVDALTRILSRRVGDAAVCPRGDSGDLVGGPRERGHRGAAPAGAGRVP